MELKKKQITITLISLLVLAALSTIALLIYGEIMKNTAAKIAGLVGTIISPSMLVGIAVKFWLNKKQLKDIDNKLSAVGLNEIELIPVENPKVKVKADNVFQLKGVTIIKTKQRKFIVSWKKQINKQIELDNLKWALAEFMEKEKKGN